LPIKELNPQEFAKHLAQQALSYVPADINEEHKKYITNKVFQFCSITAEHLISQFKDQFTDEQAVVVVQFIGEWTFHKAIDLIRSGLRYEYWDTILQQVAFAALKAALHAHTEKMEQAETAGLIEAQVMEAYKACIDQLVKSKVIQEDKAEEVLSQSNVDRMAQESAQNEAGASQDDEKTLKYVAIALILKKMPQEKANKILEKMSEEERQRILSCLQIEDIESKVDPVVMNKYIQDLKKSISRISKPNQGELIRSFKKLQEKYGEEEIINLTMYERPKIQEFLSNCILEDASNITKVELSTHIVKILYNYLRIKLAA